MRYILLVLLALLIIPASLASWKHSEAKSITNDTATLLKLSKPLLGEEYSVQIKWSAEGAGYTSLTGLKNLNKQLSQKLGIQSGEHFEYVNDLPVLRSLSLLADGAQIQSMFVGSKDQKTTIWIIELLPAPRMMIDQIVQAQSTLEQKLVSLGFKGSWNIMVQGALIDDKIGEHPQNSINKIKDEIAGSEQEIYQEANTVSISFLSPHLKTAVQSGNHKVNLQVALHQNSITKSWRLTLGAPLITIEY